MVNSDSTQVRIKHPSLPHRLLKRIPKAARPQTGRLLTTIINKILNDSRNPTTWQMLLTFGAAILEQPKRGGRRHNLSSAIKKRVDDFQTTWQLKRDEIFSENPSSINNKERSKAADDQAVAAAVASKLEDGNIRAAIRILCSNDRPVKADPETLEELLAKHPVPPPDRPCVTTKHTAAPYQAAEEQVLGQIRSFPLGSSGGPDGLRPQHLSDLVNCAEIGSELISAITGLINLLLAGECPEQIRPILFGGTLMALRKDSGGLRPIVIGYYWRRLASKCANTYAVPKATAYLAPRQVGVGHTGRRRSGGPRSKTVPGSNANRVHPGKA